MAGKGKPMSVKPDGRGGEYHHYFVNGQHHPVHVDGETGRVVHASLGFGRDEVGRLIGAMEHRIKEAEDGVKSPRESHAYEVTLNGLRNAYAALSASSRGTKGRTVSPKMQEEMAEIADKIGDMMQGIRNNNEHLPRKKRAELNTSLAKFVEKVATKAAREATGNDAVRYDVYLGGFVDAGGKGVSEDDYDSLVGSGIHRDLSGGLDGLIRIASQKLPDEVVDTHDKQSAHGFGFPHEAYKGRPWYHDDMDEANKRFMTPVHAILSKLYEALLDKHVAAGDTLEEASRKAEAEVHGMNEAVSRKLGGGAHVYSRDVASGKGHTLIHLPDAMRHHGTLMAMEPFRKELVKRLVKHFIKTHSENRR